MNIIERLIAWLEWNKRPCEERDLLNDALVELERRGSNQITSDTIVNVADLVEERNTLRTRLASAETVAGQIAESKSALAGSIPCYQAWMEHSSQRQWELYRWRVEELGRTNARLAEAEQRYVLLKAINDNNTESYLDEVNKHTDTLKRLAAAEKLLNADESELVQLLIVNEKHIEEVEAERDRALGLLANAEAAIYAAEERLAEAELLWLTAVECEGMDWANDMKLLADEAAKGGRDA